MSTTLLNTTRLNGNKLSFYSMINQECKARREIVNVNSNNPIFYPFSVKTSKCSGNCNSINDPYTKICVPDVVKDLNVNVFNLMSRTNETRNIEWHETCKCECRLDAIVCNGKQRWNNDKCRCECNELIAKRLCDIGYVWNPSNCECECDTSCDVGDVLEIVQVKVDECTETVKEVNPAIITLSENENSFKYNSWIVYTVLFWICFIIIVGISPSFAYYKYKNRGEKCF